MIPLSAQGRPSPALRNSVIGRITLQPVEAGREQDHILVSNSIEGKDVRGYAGVLATQTEAQETLNNGQVPLVHGLGPINHLVDGDVVAMSPNGHVRTLYRIHSPHNAIFATDRCSSFCLMCSQPPRDVDDSARIAEHLRLIELMSPATAELGISGGEPTLMKDGLLEVIRRCKELLPRTALHILSNGRLFYYGSFARKVAEIDHPDLMIGIPLYSDIDYLHDYVVQCRGAFDDTMVGLHNLGRFGVRVEVRVVIHRLTHDRLRDLAEFIYRNLPFASHVALMGLEMMGFTIPNQDTLWIDPWDYRHELERATLFLASRGLQVSIYNHQLCTVPETLWPFCRKSISDWKNEYLPVCEGCSIRADCGGLFASNLKRRHSAHIHAFAAGQLGQV
jgi:His-Xaa-Ser system radical SAM maturase HxsC